MLSRLASVTPPNVGRVMADTQFLRLSEKWALAYDPLQWIVQRRGSFDKRRGKWNWEGVAFVATNRDVLFRVLREKGAVTEPDKMDALMALPPTFQEWLDNRRPRGTVLRGVRVPSRTIRLGKVG